MGSKRQIFPRRITELCNTNVLLLTTNQGISINVLKNKGLIDFYLVIKYIKKLSTSVKVRDLQHDSELISFWFTMLRYFLYSLALTYLII